MLRTIEEKEIFWQNINNEVGYDAREAIRLEFAEFKTKMYKGLTKEERKKYGMVYTPADVSIRMIERFSVDTLSGHTILDPCCGSGNLLVACLLAGADADKLLGNEFNPKMVKLARKRIQDICNNIQKYPTIHNREKFKNLHYHIHIGDALNPYCITHFSSKYNFNLVNSTGRTDADPEEDDAEPTPNQALLTFGSYPKDCEAKQLIKKLEADEDYPVADANDSLTAEDYESILVNENLDVEEQYELKQQQKEQKLKEETACLKQRNPKPKQPEMKQQDLFDNLEEDTVYTQSK